MAEREALTADYVRSILDYNPETGEFMWRERPREHFASNRAHAAWNARYQCAVAGTIVCEGRYVSITVDCRRYLAHRIAWLHMNGEWPQGRVDHINVSGTDNRIDNLRIATMSQNLANIRPHRDNTSGFKGVSWASDRKKWCAKICVNGRQIHLGGFDNPDDAAKKYKQAAEMLYGEFARTQ